MVEEAPSAGDVPRERSRLRARRSRDLAFGAAVLLGLPLAAAAYRFGAPVLAGLFREGSVRAFVLVTPEGQKRLSPDLRAPARSALPAEPPRDSTALLKSQPVQTQASAPVLACPTPPAPPVGPKAAKPPQPPVQAAKAETPRQEPPKKARVPLPKLRPGTLKEMDQAADSFLLKSLTPAPAQSAETAPALAAIRGFTYSQVVGATVSPGAPAASQAPVTTLPSVKPVAAPPPPPVKRVFYRPAGNGSRVTYPEPPPAADGAPPQETARNLRSR